MRISRPPLRFHFEYISFQNGEIYNYQELKKRLQARCYQFISESDTEVLAHGFAEWGADGLLQKLDGMYAIALLDRGTRELHLARDRFGEKPLFFSCAKGRRHKRPMPRLAAARSRTP